MNNTLNPVFERTTLSSYSASRKAKPVNLYRHAHQNAKSVNLAGDFNDPNPHSLPMQRRPDGWWFIQVPLTLGHHQYLFPVIGKPAVDPHVTGTVRIKLFGEASVIVVN